MPNRRVGLRVQVRARDFGPARRLRGNECHQSSFREDVHDVPEIHSSEGLDVSQRSSQQHKSTADAVRSNL